MLNSNPSSEESSQQQIGRDPGELIQQWPDSSQQQIGRDPGEHTHPWLDSSQQGLSDTLDDLKTEAATHMDQMQKETDTEEKDEEKRVKLSIEVTPALNQVVDRMADLMGTTKSGVMRKAIALLDVAVEAKGNGERLFVSKTPPSGSSREIIGL
jgi:hypothetical protein